MAFVESITCDMCNTPKQETNHWFMMNKSSNDIEFMDWDLSNFKEYYHLCGQACAIKALSIFFTNREVLYGNK